MYSHFQSCHVTTTTCASPGKEWRMGLETVQCGVEFNKTTVVVVCAGGWDIFSDSATQYLLSFGGKMVGATITCDHLDVLTIIVNK